MRPGSALGPQTFASAWLPSCTIFDMDVASQSGTVFFAINNTNVRASTHQSMLSGWFGRLRAALLGTDGSQAALASVLEAMMYCLECMGGVDHTGALSRAPTSTVGDSRLQVSDHAPATGWLPLSALSGPIPGSFNRSMWLCRSSYARA